MIERNRRFLLEDDGADGILVRRVARARGLATVPAPQVARRATCSLVAPGDLVPVDARAARADERARSPPTGSPASPRRAHFARGDARARRRVQRRRRSALRLRALTAFAATRRSPRCCAQAAAERRAAPRARALLGSLSRG